jgi:hypothetical protein
MSKAPLSLILARFYRVSPPPCVLGFLKSRLWTSAAAITFRGLLDSVYHPIVLRSSFISLRTFLHSNLFHYTARWFSFRFMVHVFSTVYLGLGSGSFYLDSFRKKNGVPKTAPRSIFVFFFIITSLPFTDFLYITPSPRFRVCICTSQYLSGRLIVGSKHHRFTTAVYL